MKLVKSLNEYNQFVQGFRASEKHPASNCYLLPAEINSLTQHERLFWHAYPGGFLFLCEKSDFYKLCFFNTVDFQPASIGPLHQLSKPLVINIVYSVINPPQWLSACQSFWIGNGFRVHTKYWQTAMPALLTGQDADLPIRLDSQLYSIKNAVPEQLEEIKCIWRSNLGRISAVMPFDDELLASINEKQIYVALDRDGNIAATQQITLSGNTCLLSHGVCVPHHRRKGLLRSLIHTCMNHHKNINRYVSWVDVANPAAMMMHQSIGLEPNGRESLELINQNQEINV